MKQKLIVGLAALALGQAALRAGTLPIYVNPSDTIVPSLANPTAPIVDATAFLNPQGLTFSITDPFGTAMFDFSDCLNFTNLGYMFGSPGFDFETKGNGAIEAPPRPAAWFVNQGSGANGGIIDVSGVSLSFGGVLAGTTPVLLLNGNGEVIVRATNIIHSGTIDMGSSSLIQLAGDNVDLTHGNIVMTNPAQFFGFFNSGILDGYWGTGAEAPAGMNPTFDLGGSGFTPAFSPIHFVTNRTFLTGYTEFAMPYATTNTYAAQFPDATGTNILNQVVFVSNTNAAFNISVFLEADFGIVVQWEWLSTNWPTLSVTTNFVYLVDTFGEETNIGVFINGTAGNRNTYIPRNYFFVQGAFGGIPDTAIPGADLALLPFPNATITNQYAAYEAIFTTTTSLPSDVAGGDVTNLPGRIEISAKNSLDLTDTRISSLNYLKVNSPNQFLGSRNAQIISPFSDFNLGSTNGSLAFTNLVAPFVPFPCGFVNLYSARFTNAVGGVIVGTNGLVGATSNSWHVLFVDSELAPITTPMVHSLDLSASNVFISDIVNVSSNILIQATGLTITTNTDSPFVPTGQLNLFNTAILWPSATPRLQYFTNWGQFDSLNAVFFGGSRTQPSFDPSSINIPYQTFINHGWVTNLGTYVWAKYFENSGAIDSGTGPTELQLGFSVRLHDGVLNGANSDVSLTASDMVVTNHFIQSGGALTLTVTNYLDDGSYLLNSADSISNKNTWVAGAGLNLPMVPPYSGLLGTTLLSTNVTRVPQLVRWAGEDRGCSPSGYTNNVALGHLVLGGTDPASSFTFVPATGANAIYVDELEIVGALGDNTDNANNFLGISIPANMKIYYAQAFVNGSPYAVKLNGKNNGGFCWVSNYNWGFFSSTIVDYPQPGTPQFPAGPHRLNAALVQYYADKQLGLIPILPGQSDTPPTNPPAVYPAVVLFDEYTNSVSGSTNSVPPVVSGPAVLDIPSASQVGAPANNFTQASYSGLFADSNAVAVASSGYFTVRTTPKGRYSGKIVVAGRAYPFSGQFDASGIATPVIARHTFSLQFWVVSGDASEIMGQVSGAGWSADLFAFRQATRTSTPPAASLRGTFTFLIPPDVSGPSGWGSGTLKTDAAGNVRWAGSLADGSKVSQSGFFSSEGLWALYSPLYGGRGSVLGWQQISFGTATNVSGQVVWVKPAGLGSKYYPAGFTNDVEAIGSSYTRRSGAAVLDLNAGAGTLSLSGGGLPAPIANDIQLDVHNRVHSTTSPAPTLKINTATGLFSGSVTTSSVGRILFQGALFQNGNFAAGSFLGPINSGQSGEVLLAPAQ